MKRLYLALVLIFAITLEVSPVGREDGQRLLLAYGYIDTHQFVLDNIKRSHPSLASDVVTLEKAFERKFPQAQKAILKQLKQFGVTKAMVENDLDQSIELHQSRYVLLKQIEIRENAVKTLENMKLMLVKPDGFAQNMMGIVCDAIYEDQPEKEFKHHYQTYSTKDNIHALGLNMSLRLPLSFSSVEGQTETNIQNFTKWLDSSLIIVGILVLDEPEMAKKMTKSHLKNAISDKSALSNVFPKGLVKAYDNRVVKVDGHDAVLIGGLVKHENAEDGANYTYESKLSFAVEDKVVSINFMVIDNTEKQVMHAVNEYKKVREMMIKSIKIGKSLPRVNLEAEE